MFIQIKNIQIRFSINKVTKVKGFNNKLPDNKFFPMWDFDNCQLTTIVPILQEIQRSFLLPEIKIIESSNSHYHAICFKSMEWTECKAIMSSTSMIDNMFLALAITRGYATLRISPRSKTDIKPHLITILSSKISSEENEIRPLIKGVEYDTRTK